MKKKQLIAALGMTLVLLLAISGCAAGTQSTTETAASETVTVAAENTELENTSVNETESTEAAAAENETAPADGQTPPEMPDGETPPEMPDGENGPVNGEQPPEKPDGESENGGPGGNMQGGPGGSGSQGGAPGGGSSQPESYDAATEYSGDTTVSGKTIASTGTNENAVHVMDGAEVTFSKMTITRESSDSDASDSASFYGVGAAVLATEGTAYITDSTIETDAGGGAGVFAYGDGTVYVSDTKITTRQGASGGIHAAGGGTLYAYDLDVTTYGGSSAAIRSDRGGGTMVVDEGTYTSNGSESPAIYSTADITVDDAVLTANGSEAICVEGLNTVRLFDCDLTGNMSDDEQNDCTWNVILYQSMSGDSVEGNSTFEMVGGTLTAKNGGMFYTTNTESTFILEDVDITYAAENDFFLKCTGNSNARGWGSTGENGADCNFTAIEQVMEGDVIWDSISNLDFYMTDGSTLKGAAVQDESNAGNGGRGYANFYIDKTSTWIVTGDSTLKNLYNAGTIKDASGNTVTIKGTDGTVYVQGTSSYTVTVESYSTSVDLSGASKTDTFEMYEVEEPAQID